MTTPFAWSDEFQINTIVTNAQSFSAMTALQDGRFVVAWADRSRSPDDTAFDVVRARIINADGTASAPEFLVDDPAIATRKSIPDIVTLADGRFLLAWTRGGSSGGLDNAVVGQIFNADGTRSGTVFTINSSTTDLEKFTRITALDNGGFVATWEAEVNGSVIGTSLAQVFDNTGNPAGPAFPVGLPTPNSQSEPAVTALADGRFVIAWSDGSILYDDPSPTAIRAQVYNADGSTSGGEFQVNTTTSGVQTSASLAGLADGRIVIVWTDFGQAGPGDTSGSAVRGQILNADGSKSGGEFLVNTITSGNQVGSSVIALSDGRFAVAWTDLSQSPDDPSMSAVRAQVFNADGSTSGREFRVNTTTVAQQNSPSMTELADGRLVISWSDDSAGVFLGDHDIRGTIFDPRLAAVRLNGTLADDEFHGTIFADLMRGSFGNDNLFGAAGDDELAGGQGNDALTGGRGNDWLLGDIGDDQLFGNLGSDVLEGGSGNDLLNGGLGVDAMIGGLGNDTHVVDSASDLVIENAGEGTDQVQSAVISLNLASYANVENASLTGVQNLGLTGTAGANALSGNTGANVIQGLGGNDTLIGNAGDDVLRGSGGNDALDGGNGLDTLEGGSGNDVLNGGASGDSLDGGSGDDILTGGLGADRFMFAADHQTARITDFEDGKDKINLATYSFASAAAAKAFAVQDGANVVFTFAPGNVLTVDNVTLAQLTNADFILV